MGGNLQDTRGMGRGSDGEDRGEAELKFRNMLCSGSGSSWHSKSGGIEGEDRGADTSLGTSSAH